MIKHLCIGWSMIYPFAIHLNFSPKVTITPYLPQLTSTMIVTVLVMSMSNCLQHISSMQNTFMMLSSTNNITCQISNMIVSLSYPNTKKYLMAPLDSTLTRKFTSNSNQELSQFVIMLTLSLTYIIKPLRSSLITLLKLVSLSPMGPLNVCPLLSLYQKRWLGWEDNGFTTP